MKKVFLPIFALMVMFGCLSDALAMSILPGSTPRANRSPTVALKF